MNKFIALFLMLFTSSTFGESPFNGLDAIVKNNPKLKLGNFITKLPKAFKNNWTAGFYSRGLATDFTFPSDPRVLSFNPNSGVVITYSNCVDELAPLTTECNNLEAIGYDEKTNEFELRVYKFPKAQDSITEIKVLKNPAKCTFCHGERPKPLWEPYNFWPGVFGSISGHREDVVTSGTNELKALTSFLEKHFEDEDGESALRYTSLNMRDYTSVIENDKDIHHLPFGTNKSPSNGIASVFYKQNFKRVAKDLVTIKGIEKKKFMLGWFAECYDPLPDISYYVNDWFIDPGIDKLYTLNQNLLPYMDLREAMEAQFRKDLRAAKGVLLEDSADGARLLSKEGNLIYYNQAIPVIFRMFEVIGYDYFNFYLSHDLQPYNVATVELGTVWFHHIFRDQMLKTHPKVMKMSCKNLISESKKHL